MSDRKYHITRSTRVSPKKGCPHCWLKFLTETTGGDEGFMRFLQQLCGYCLSGDVSENKLFFIYGPGGNGKSVFINTLDNIMGDYAATAPVETFSASRNDNSSNALAMLRGARLVSVNETESGMAWKENLIKQLTGGDNVTARFLYHEYFTYKPQFKLIVVGNYKPRLVHVDDAMRRRLHIIPFVRKPAQPDKHLEDKLKSEYPQILNWMIEGFKDWQEHGFAVPEVVRSATDEYFVDQDLFGQWIIDSCECDPSYESLSSQLYSVWKLYATHAGEDAGSIPAFSDNMMKHGFSKVRKRNGMVYRGIKPKAVLSTPPM